MSLNLDLDFTLSIIATKMTCEVAEEVPTLTWHQGNKLHEVFGSLMHAELAHVVDFDRSRIHNGIRDLRAYLSFLSTTGAECSSEELLELLERIVDGENVDMYTYFGESAENDENDE